MIKYDFPPPLDFNEPTVIDTACKDCKPCVRRYIRLMYDSYANSLSPAVARILASRMPTAGAVYDEIDRETLAQMADAVIAKINGNEADRALVRMMLLLQHP